MSLAPGGGSKEVILEDWKSSAEALKVEKVSRVLMAQERRMLMVCIDTLFHTP